MALPGDPTQESKCRFSLQLGDEAIRYPHTSTGAGTCTLMLMQIIMSAFCVSTSFLKPRSVLKPRAAARLGVDVDVHPPLSTELA